MSIPLTSRAAMSTVTRAVSAPQVSKAAIAAASTYQTVSKPLAPIVIAEKVESDIRRIAAESAAASAASKEAARRLTYGGPGGGRLGTGQVANEAAYRAATQPLMVKRSISVSPGAIAASQKIMETSGAVGKPAPTPYAPPVPYEENVPPAEYVLPVGEYVPDQPYVAPQTEYGPAEYVAAQEETRTVALDEPFIRSSGSSDLVPVTSTSTALVVAHKPSIWTRIANFFRSLFGFGPKKVESKITGERPELSMSEGAAQLVRRARNGDQNAMAILALVARNARMGNVQAKMASTLIHQYIAANPVSGAATMHGDGVQSLFSKSVRMSHGEMLFNPRIKTLLSEFGRDERRAFLYGMDNGMTIRKAPTNILKANALGKVIGDARKLQRVRLTNSSISEFDSNVGWELE